MSYLSFKKDQLINLEYSLNKEFLGTNRGGGYCSSTLVFCNTRKYHGLLVVPLENFMGENWTRLLYNTGESLTLGCINMRMYMSHEGINI